MAAVGTSMQLSIPLFVSDYADKVANENLRCGLVRGTSTATLGRFVMGHEARSRSEVEQAIVAVHSAMELEDFGVGYVIAFGPHLAYSWHPLEQREGAAHASAGTVSEEG